MDEKLVSVLGLSPYLNHNGSAISQSPIDGKILGSISETSNHEIEPIIQNAKKAF